MLKIYLIIVFSREKKKDNNQEIIFILDNIIRHCKYSHRILKNVKYLKFN